MSSSGGIGRWGRLASPLGVLLPFVVTIWGDMTVAVGGGRRGFRRWKEEE